MIEVQNNQRSFCIAQILYEFKNVPGANEPVYVLCQEMSEAAALLSAKLSPIEHTITEIQWEFDVSEVTHLGFSYRAKSELILCKGKGGKMVKTKYWTSLPHNVAYLDLSSSKRSHIVKRGGR